MDKALALLALIFSLEQSAVEMGGRETGWSPRFFLVVGLLLLYLFLYLIT